MAPRRAHEFAALALAGLSAAAALSLGRVFASASFVLPVVGAAVLPHALGLVTRRRSWHRALALAISLLGVVLYAIWVTEPSTTQVGLPTPESFDALSRHLQQGYDELRTAVVPAPVTDGALLLAVLATWVVAQAADLLAFRRDATVAAVAPALALFLWASTLGSDDLRLRTTIGFAAAAVVFLLLQHQALLEHRRARFAGRRVGTGTGLVAAGAVAGLAAVIGGVVVGPALPGAGSPALIDVKAIGASGGGSAGYRTEPPLARIGENFIQPRETELFEVRAPAPDYWRIVALDRYSSDAGGQWTLSASGSDEVAEGLDAPEMEDTLLQEFTISGLDGRWMPAAYRPVDVEGGDALVVKASTTLVTGRESVTGLRYAVRSRVPPAADTLTGAGRATDRRVPAELADAAALPADFPDELRNLAAAVTVGAATPYDRARALEQFFLDPSSGFTYSLDADVELGPGAQSASAISEFVLQSRRGFCVQFAGSYAVMARAVGLPARVAVGYTPGDYDARSGVFRVTTFDAHAWPEVWLAGVGWTRFEPTPPSPLPGGSELPGRTAAPAVAPGTATNPSATTAAAPPPSGAPATPAPVDARPTTDVTIDAPAPSDDGGGGLISFSWKLVALVAAASIAATLVAGAVIVGAKARRRSRRRDRLEPSKAITGAWEEALDRLDEAGVRPRPELTPFELARAADVEAPAVEAPLRALAATYTAVRYGPTPPAADDVDDAWGHVDEIDRALRDEASFRERWRRRLDPAPLRR